MKRSAVYSILIAAIFFPTTGFSAKNEPSKWKALQIRHLTARPGLGISQQDLNYGYQGLLEEMRRSKPAEQILEEGSRIPPDDAANSVFMEGTFVSYDPPHGLHLAEIQFEIKLYRMSDRRLVMTTNWHHGRLRVPSGQGKAWLWVGGHAAKAFINDARNLQPLASFPPAPPSTEIKASVPAAAPQAPSNAEVLTDNSIVEMVTARIPEEVIIAKIQISPNNFDLSTPALAELTQKGVSPAVMKAMLMMPKQAATPVPTKSETSPNADWASPTVPHHKLPYKAAELRHFTIAEGVEFPPKQMDPQVHLDALYEKFLKDVQKQGIATQVLREGESIPEADATDALLIEGKITDFRKNSGNLIHPPELSVQLNVYRRRDHGLIATVTLKTKILYQACVKQNFFANTIGPWTAREIKKALQ